MKLKGIGPTSAWLFVMEFFAWRQFRNRREVGSLGWADPYAYQSGEESHDQGISKAGNRLVRAMAIEIAWGWLRYQPESELARWYYEVFGEGGKRRHKVGIVALARKLLVALMALPGERRDSCRRGTESVTVRTNRTDSNLDRRFRSWCERVVVAPGSVRNRLQDGTAHQGSFQPSLGEHSIGCLANPESARIGGCSRQILPDASSRRRRRNVSTVQGWSPGSCFVRIPCATKTDLDRSVVSRRRLTRNLTNTNS